MSKLALSKSNKKLAGVCGGLSEWANIDASMVRLIFVIATIIGVGSPILIYLLLALIMN